MTPTLTAKEAAEREARFPIALIENEPWALAIELRRMADSYRRGAVRLRELAIEASSERPDLAKAAHYKMREGHFRGAADTLDRLTALLAEARACLEPFALAPQDAFLGGGKNSMPAGMPDHSVVPAGVIKWGMVRAAAALHEKLAQEWRSTGKWSAAAGKEE